LPFNKLEIGVFQWKGVHGPTQFYPKTIFNLNLFSMYFKTIYSKFPRLILLLVGLMLACNQLEENQIPLVAEESSEELIPDSENSSSFRLANVGNCQTDCIYAGTDQYFEKSGSVLERSKNSTKEVAYTARQENGLFRVTVDFNFSGTSNGNLSLSININGSEVSINPSVSGQSFSHEIALLQHYSACDAIPFAIKQTGLGKSIMINEVFQLIPVCEPKVPVVGEEYQGGKVVYIFQEGDIGYVPGEVHGMILADLFIENAPWGCKGTSIVTSDAIGSGPANTKAIIAACSQLGIAARLVDDLEFKGFSDWYLPSSGEIILANLFEEKYFQEIVFGQENRFLTSSQTSPDLVYVWATWDFGLNQNFKDTSSPSLAFRNF
jgi:hypothetical protein